MKKGFSEKHILSNGELKLVSGGLANFAIGGAIGALGYGAYSLASGEFSWGGLAGSVAAGSISGGFSALAGGGRATIAYFGGIGGATGGLMDKAVEQYITVTGR